MPVLVVPEWGDVKFVGEEKGSGIEIRDRRDPPTIVTINQFNTENISPNEAGQNPVAVQVEVNEEKRLE